MIEGLPETEIEITQGDIQSLIDRKPSENIIDYWNKLNEVEKGILTAKAQELFRTGI